MAKQQATSGLAGRLGAQGQKAFEAHKGDETVLAGGGELPAGIENGVAELVLCKFGVYKDGENAGKDFWMAQGVVLEPKEVMVDGANNVVASGGRMIRTEGLRTGVGPEPLFDTPSRSRATFDDHFAWVLNQWRLLGVDTKSIDFKDVELVAGQLQQSKVKFTFRTWKGQKQTTGAYAGQEPRTVHTWQGALKGDYVPSDSGDEGIVDNSASPYAPQDDDKQATVHETAETQSEPDGELDLAALGSAADLDPESEAAVQLDALAKEHGIDSSVIPTWAEVAAQLEEKMGAGDGGSNEAATTASSGDEKPAVGECYYLKVNKEGKPDPKGAKTLEIEITAIFDGNQSCNAKDLATQKVIRGVKWYDLRGEA